MSGKEPREAGTSSSRSAVGAGLAAALSIAALLVAALPSSGAEKQAPPSTPPSGLVEKTGVSLILLDIEAVDRAGNPLRGLHVGDFAVRRSGRPWPVISVDDFCACDDPAGAGVVPAAEQTGAGEDAASPPPTPIDHPLFVIYIDFSQLRPDGRHDVLEAARRWVREVKAADEPAMIAAYITSRGLLTLSRPTSDRAELLRVLDAADHDPVMIDPFAYDMLRRVTECEDDPTTCADSARQEYSHGRRSLEAFKMFLFRLGGMPGRKAVLYFHETGMMTPGPLYFQRDDQTHYTLAEGIGAEATAARAVVYPLLAGMDDSLRGRMNNQLLNLGAMLAEATGGAYNLGPTDFAGLAMTAGRGCRCRYVLGLEPVEAFSRSISTVAVTARGTRLRPLYRMRLLTDEDVWLRQASRVLDDPASAQDIAIGAALVPLRVTGRTWDIAAQVAVDVRSLVLIPLGARHEARWEIGARLQRLDGHGSWDMLATSVGSAGATGAPDAVLLHAREFTGLHPGRYRMTAFVRDRVANIFGGAEALIDLPDPKRGGVAGPVMLADRPLRVLSPLPLVTEQATDASGGGRGAQVVGAQDAGPAPVAPLPTRRGTTLLFESWLCPAPGGATPEAIATLSRDDTPLFRVAERAGTPGVGVAPAGAPEAGAPQAGATPNPCRRRVDEVPTAALDADRYTYILRARSADGTVAMLPVPFVVASPAGPADRLAPSDAEQ